MRNQAMVIAVLALLATAVSAQPDSQRQAELENLLRQDCGSCHGLTLRGGLGPALTADALSGRTREGLAAAIRYGRPGTPMPPWDGLLSDADVDWLVDAMLEGVRHD